MRSCDFCEKPAAAVVDETTFACAECMAVHLGPGNEEICLRWLDQEPERNGTLYTPDTSLYLPKRFLLERLAEAERRVGEEIDGLELLKRELADMKKQGLDYGIVGGTGGPGIRFARQGEMKDGDAGALMVSGSPLGFGGASEHVTKALYSWLEREEKP